MKKRIFSKLTVLFTTLLMLFVSCGKEEAKVNNEVPTLKIITIGGGQPANYDSWVKKVNEYIEPKIGAKVSVEVISWGDWDSKRNVIATSNTPFDILFGNIATYANDVSTGLYLDLSPLLKEKEFKPLYNSMPESIWDGIKINGEIYAVPTYKDSSITQYFVIDSKYAKESNLDLSGQKDLPYFDSLLRRIKKETNKPSLLLNNMGVYQIFNNYDTFGLPFNVLGVKVDDKDMKVVNMLEQPEIKNDLNFIHKWYKDGIINPDAPVTTQTPKYKPFFIAQGWPLAAKTVWGPQNGTDVDLVQYGPTIISNGSIQGSLNGISASSEYPKKALEFLQLINTDNKLRDMFAYGEETINFDYVQKFGENRVHRNDKNQWPLPAYAQATFFNMSITDDVKENQWNEVKKLNENATPSVLLGFTFNIEPVINEIANVNAIWNKYEADLLNGVNPPKEEVAKIMKEMKAVGLDKIQKEAQKQVNEFKANNSK